MPSLERAKGAEELAESDTIKQQVTDLHDEMSAPILAYLRKLGLVESDAGDVVQETFLRLMDHLVTGRPAINLRAWLYQVAYSQAMDIHRFGSRFSSFSEDTDDGRTVRSELPDSAPSPEEILIENERFQRIRVALRCLPTQQRECVMLRSEGLRYREIAVSLGVSTQRVAILVGRGVSRLGAIL